MSTSAFVLSVLCFIGFVLAVLFQYSFAGWETAFSFCLLLGWSGAALAIVGIVAFLFGKPKRLLSVICGIAALALGGFVYFYMLSHY